jgi:DNA-binding transcriptional MerR regulator
MNSTIKFTIEQVADMVGVSKAALRYWEKVYDVHPDRSDGNQRRYSQEQVGALLKIKSLYDEGFAMKGIKARLAEKWEEAV